jgi:hypothetical protein
LPWGAVELDADELPAAPQAPATAVGDAKPAASAPGDDEALALLVTADRESTPAEAAASDEPAPAEVAPSDEPAPAVAADDHESAAPEPPDSPLAGVASPWPQLDEAAEVIQAPEEDLTATDDRWHAVLVGFVDNPRGSVEAARALVGEDIGVLIALLARHKEAMRDVWPAEKDADTEALRVALVNYRELRNRLADVITALTA